jgi:pimeloyl-ACP methyl ester carboxylesterase
MRAMMQQETMPTEGLPPMLKDLHAAVSPDGPEHWDAVVAKLWRLYRTEPNIPLGELTKVAAPTLIVVAEHDMLTPEHGEAMRRAMADARLEVVAGASHGLPMEQPEAVARLVSAFLDRPAR